MEKALTFSGKTDIGNSSHPGSIRGSSDGRIQVTGSGQGIGKNQDSFYFVWNKMEGDVFGKTDIAWENEKENSHSKAGWMIRSGLNPDDAYAAAVVHGGGLISLQYRKTNGGATYEIPSPLRTAKTISLARTGDQFTVEVSDSTGVLHPIGTITVGITGHVYAGLFVCSDNPAAQATALFSNIVYSEQEVVPLEKRVIESTLEIMNIETGVRTIVRRAKEHFEAPNWSRDAKMFIYNSGGEIYTIPAAGGTPLLIDTGFAVKCNNDHGISWDGKELVISHHAEDGKSLIYILPAGGGEPRLVTKKGPSYWHGISPDNKTLAYCAERNGVYDVYTISSDGGEENRLTSTPGLDDGPEYSPDGKYIYYNSVRTGQMKIWRMKPDGSEQTQFTPADEYGDWFAHPSPDNKQIVFVSYDKSVDGHPANKDVVLRSMSTAGGDIKIIAYFFGGQGTINVHSWSPDSKEFAFVSYRLVAP
jgi:TolB protein